MLFSCASAPDPEVGWQGWGDGGLCVPLSSFFLPPDEAGPASLFLPPLPNSVSLTAEIFGGASYRRGAWQRCHRGADEDKNQAQIKEWLFQTRLDLGAQLLQGVRQLWGQHSPVPVLGRAFLNPPRSSALLLHQLQHHCWGFILPWLCHLCPGAQPRSQKNMSAGSQGLGMRSPNPSSSSGHGAGPLLG